MIVTNCTVMGEYVKVDLRAVLILVILIGIKSIYKHVVKKKLSPIMLIVLSSIVGVVVLSIQ
jgi:TctA family transporter